MSLGAKRRVLDNRVDKIKDNVEITLTPTEKEQYDNLLNNIINASSPAEIKYNRH